MEFQDAICFDIFEEVGTIIVQTNSLPKQRTRLCNGRAVLTDNVIDSSCMACNHLVAARAYLAEGIPGNIADVYIARAATTIEKHYLGMRARTEVKVLRSKQMIERFTDQFKLMLEAQKR